MRNSIKNITYEVRDLDEKVLHADTTLNSCRRWIAKHTKKPVMIYGIFPISIYSGSKKTYDFQK